MYSLKKLIVLIALMASVFPLPNITFSQSPNNSPQLHVESEWEIPINICGQDHCDLMFRSDGEDLFALSRNNLVVYKFFKEGLITIHLLREIVPRPYWANDFAIVDSDTVILLDYLDSHFFLYELLTRRLTIIDLSENIHLSHCDSLPIMFPLIREFSYLASSHEALVCTYSSLILVNPYNSEQYLPVLHLTRSSGEGRRSFWDRLVIGQDGLIYIQVADRRAFDIALPELNIADSPPDSQVILSYSSNESAWQQLILDPQIIQQLLPPNGDLDDPIAPIPHLAGVDDHSDLYFYQVYRDINKKTQNNILKIDKHGNVYWNIHIEDFEGGFDTFFDFIDSNKFLLGKYEEESIRLAVVTIIEN